MKASYRALLAMHYVSMGIMAPVLSLVFLDRGCTLNQLAILMGIYAGAVLVLELPSGIMADILGRKNIFMIACLFDMVALLCLLFAYGFVWLIPAVVFWGAGRSFASGSVDAMIIDAHIETHGIESMPTVISELSILETAGISVGAMLGGVLPTISRVLLPLMHPYNLNLIIRGFIGAVLITTGAAVLKEKPRESGSFSSMKQLLAQSVRFAGTNRLMRLLLLSVFCSGLFLFTIETYWQPAYLALANNERMWTLGLLSSGYFLFACAGSLFAKRVFSFAKKFRPYGYTIFRVLAFCSLISVAREQTPLGFGIAFCAMYFFFGGANTAEGILINMDTPGDMRASMLSIVSLTLRAGGVFMPLYAGTMVSAFGIQTLWSITGYVFIASAGLIGVLLVRVKKAERTETTETAIEGTRQE